MKTPDEITASAKSWAWSIVSTLGILLLGILFGAMAMSLCHCEKFTPQVDPAPYPCHDPRMHYCTDGKTCCFDGYACVGGPYTTDPSGPPRCEYVGPVGAALKDSGVDSTAK